MPAARKSTQQHKTQGTFRRDRHGAPEAHEEPLAVAPPQHLAPAFLEAWHEIVAAADGYITTRDALACEVCAVLLTKFRMGQGSAAELAHLRALLAQLGLTPAARRGLDFVTPPDDDDPAERFFREHEMRSRGGSRGIIID